MGYGALPLHLIQSAEQFSSSPEINLASAKNVFTASKYPPAEPEALCFEPLKAAACVRCSCQFPFWVLLVRTIVPKIRIPQWQFGRFSSLRSFVSQSNIQKQKTGAYSRKCQTVTATPAKPGALPFGVDPQGRSTI
jgi:hypothetical protein